MKTILVTGANRGLGLEFVKQYAAEGWQVFACSRQLAAATALTKLAEQYANVHLSELDVSDMASMRALKQEIGEQPVDILLNNAGVIGGDKQRFGEIAADQWQAVFATNSFAPLMMAQIFLDNVARSQMKTIANISSVLGSIALNESSGYYLYRASKAALNAITKNMALDLKNRQIKVVALHPGWVKTDMGGENAEITPEQSIAGLKVVLAKLTAEQSGSLINYKGERLAW